MKWILGLLFLIAITIIVFHVGEIETFTNLIRQIKLIWLGLALLFQICTYISYAGVWLFGLWWLNEKASFLHLILLSLSELFINQTLPSSGLSGTTAVTQFLLQRDISHRAIALAVALNVVGRQIAYLLAFIVSIIIFWMHHPLSKAFILLAAVFIVAMILVLVGVAYLWVLASHRKIPRFIKGLHSAKSMLTAIKKLQPHLLLKISVITPAILLLLGVFVFDALTLWAILETLGITLNFSLIFAAQVVSSAIATLSIIPGGLGVFEGSLTAVLHLLGLPLETAFAATILFRGFTYWLPMIPGFLITQKEAQNKPTRK